MGSASIAQDASIRPDAAAAKRLVQPPEDNCLTTIRKLLKLKKICPVKRAGIPVLQGDCVAESVAILLRLHDIIRMLRNFSGAGGRQTHTVL
jgi:hypothetical protein